MKENETKNAEMSAERSLQIIRETMERSRKAVELQAGDSYIVWGTIVAVTALVVGHLWMHCGGPNWNLLWASIFVTAPLARKLFFKGHTTEAISPIGRIIGKVHLAMGIFASAVGFLTGTICWLFGIQYFVNITSIIILLYGIATTISGLVLKNTAVTVAGIVGGLGGYFAALAVTGAYGMVVLAGVSVVSGVLPGIVINLENRKRCSDL